MNAEQFYRIVVRMRAKQKEYFRTKNHKILIESKRIEAQVDAEIGLACCGVVPTNDF